MNKSENLSYPSKLLLCIDALSLIQDVHPLVFDLQVSISEHLGMFIHLLTL